MTVTTTTSSQTFQGNGTATAFPCAFEIILATDVNVFFVNPLTGAQTAAVMNTDYTISGAGASNGFTVNTTVPVPTGTNLYVVRALPLTQPTDFTNQGAFFPTLHEAAMDRLCMLIQQIANYSEGLNITMPPGLVPQPSTLFPVPQGGSLIGWDPTGTFLANVGASGVGAGSITDVNIAAAAAIASTKIDFAQPSSGQFFSNNGAIINRFNDRLFIGAATVNDGAYPSVAKDWLSDFQDTYAVPPAIEFAQFAALTPTFGAGGQAIVGGAQTEYFAADGGAAIGVSGYGLSNNTSYKDYAWGFYGEAHRMSNTGGAYGMELDVTNYGDFTPIDPYGQQSGTAQGQVIGLQLGGGAAHSASGQQDPSAACVIVANPVPFDKGIVFQAGSIVNGQKVAIALPTNFSIQWYSALNTPSSRIICPQTGNATQGTLQAFLDGGLYFQNPSSFTTNFAIVTSNVGANYLKAAPGATGSSPTLSVDGSDANVDLALVPKGTGNVKFGTYTTTAPTATGYITIKDSAGNTRKLLCA